MKHYRTKQESVLAALERGLGDIVEVYGAGAGLHLWLKVDDSRSHDELELLAEKAGVGIYSTVRYWMDPAKADQQTFLLGYSSIAPELIEPGIEALASAWKT